MNRVIRLACALAAMAASVGAFSADVDLAQWRMSMATNGYVAVEGKTKVSQEMRQRIWKSYREHIGYEGVQMSSPRLVATNECGGVYDLPFTTADGFENNFGVVVYRGSVRPIYWTSKGLRPLVDATTKEELSAVISERFNITEDKGVAVFATSGTLVRDAMILRIGVRVETRLPFSIFRFLFIDDEPSANWSHPARCVFVNKDYSSFAVAYVNTFCELEIGGKVLDLEPIIGLERMSERKGGNQARLLGANAGFPFTSLTDGDASKCHAMIISGGCWYPANHGRYWNDVCFAYNVLHQRYGIPRSNIKVFWASGDPDKDLCWRQANAKQCDNGCYLFANYSKDSLSDFDQDGNDDITGAATYANVRTAFNEYERMLTSDEQLFIFVTDHGGFYTNVQYATETAALQAPTQPANINLWGPNDSRTDWAALTDVQLADFTKGIKCPVIVALETCYSGGMSAEFLSSAKNRVIATADGYDVSRSGNKSMDVWAYNFFSALCGYYPAGDYKKMWAGENWLESTINPRLLGNPCNADVNGDGRISFAEAAQFAIDNNPIAEDDLPQNMCNPAQISSKLFMVQYADVSAIVVKEKVLTPTLSPASGTLEYAPCMVTASCGTSGATIRYTLDGTEPTARSAVYSGGITVADDTVVSIRAFKSGMDASDVVSIAYTVKKAAPEKPLITSVSQGDSASGIVMYWSGGAGTGYYAIRRSESASMANAVTIADQLSANVYSYLDDSAAAGREYYYQVVAFNDYGSTASAISQAGYRTLSAPASVNVSWISNEKKFQISARPL